VVLDRLRLRDRESFYSHLAFEPEPIERYQGVRQAVVPSGWKKSEDSLNRGPWVEDSIVKEEMVSRSWSEPMVKETRDEWWARCREDSYRYVPFSRKTFHLYRKFAFRIGLTGRFVPTIPFLRKKQKKWCDNSVGEGLTGPVAFERGGVLERETLEGVYRVVDGVSIKVPKFSS
jgi:hypothetical protein